MDRDRFDGLARLLATSGSRRAALGAMLGAGLLGARFEGGDGRNQHKRDERRDRRRKRSSERSGIACCAGRACAPGVGKDLAGCCYRGRVLAGSNFTGSNLEAVSFAGATLTDADFSGANLQNACFVDAFLSGADVTGAKLKGAIFCRTVMPDGAIDNSGCGRGTRCCPTCGDADHPCGAGGCDVCPQGCPHTSLQEAVAAAPDGGQVHVCPGAYGAVNVTITKTLTIVGAGPGEGGTVLDAGFGSRVLDVRGHVVIRDVAVMRGRGRFGKGGGIYVGGSSTLTLDRVLVTDNAAIEGAGIYVEQGSTLTLSRSRVADNSASRAGLGGGIMNDLGAVHLINGSVVTDNLAGQGGGIYNGGQVTIDDSSRVAGNEPDDCINRGGGASGCPPG